jgi:DNA invertase Pin-like site-specific DNA recombinase
MTTQINKSFGYARVSSKEQHLERQLDALKQYVKDPRDIFTDKASGKDFNRPGFKALMQVLRPGDCVYITSIDRLGRNYDQISKAWEKITAEIQCDIVVLDMPLLDTRKTEGLDGRFIADLTLKILSYVAQKERESIRRRQREGIESARARGKHLGRPEAEAHAWEETIKRWRSGEITAVEAMKITGLSKATFYRRVKEQNL